MSHARMMPPISNTIMHDLSGSDTYLLTNVLSLSRGAIPTFLDRILPRVYFPSQPTNMCRSDQLDNFDNPECDLLLLTFAVQLHQQEPGERDILPLAQLILRLLVQDMGHAIDGRKEPAELLFLSSHPGKKDSGHWRPGPGQVDHKLIFSRKRD